MRQLNSMREFRLTSNDQLTLLIVLPTIGVASYLASIEFAVSIVPEGWVEHMIKNWADKRSVAEKPAFDI